MGFDNDGKNFYKVVISNLEKNGMLETQFINYLCEDICSYEDISGFVSSLTRLLN